MYLLQDHPENRIFKTLNIIPKSYYHPFHFDQNQGYSLFGTKYSIMDQVKFVEDSL